MKKTVKKSAARPAMKSKSAAKPMMRKGGLTKFQTKGEYTSDLEKSYNETYGPDYKSRIRSDIRDNFPVDEKDYRATSGNKTTNPTPFPNANPSDTAYVQKIGDAQKLLEDARFRKKGGSTKAKKFAALAPPYNKATAADRIAGAKKSKSSKKK